MVLGGLERRDDLLVRGVDHRLLRARAAAPLHDGLGFLPGSACPHYDGEERRRPVYRPPWPAGLPPGYAAEDYVALHFEGPELAEAVRSLAGKRAWRVEREGERPIEARRRPPSEATARALRLDGVARVARRLEAGLEDRPAQAQLAREDQRAAGGGRAPAPRPRPSEQRRAARA